MACHLNFLLILTGLTGIYSITKVSKVTVKKGDSITVPCLYDSQYINNVKYLCKGYHWTSCSYAVKTNQPHSSGRFSISDDKRKRIFTVTIEEVTGEDTGYYWCAVEINDGGDMREYFHLSVETGTPSLYVDHQEHTGFNGGQITISCHNSNSGDVKWCRLGTSCVTGSSGNIAGTTVTIDSRVHSVFNVTMSNLSTESSGWYLCMKGDLQMPVHLNVTKKPSTTTHTTTCSTPLSETPEPVNLTSGIVPLTTAQFQQHIVSVDLKSFVIPLSLLIVSVTVAVFIWFMMKKHKKTKAAAAAPSIPERSYSLSDVEVIYSSVVITTHQNSQRVITNEELLYMNCT